MQSLKIKDCGLWKEGEGEIGQWIKELRRGKRNGKRMKMEWFGRRFVVVDVVYLD